MKRQGKAWPTKLNGKTFYKIKNFSMYGVSSCGLIHNFKLNKAISVYPSYSLKKNSYMRVALTNDDGIQKYLLYHRLLALIFIPNPKKLKTVNHKDGNKKNNSLSNLEWNSYKDNLKHAVKLKLNVAKNGEASHASKLTEIQVHEIRSLLAKKELSQAAIAHKYGVSRGCILGILTRQSWRNLPDSTHGEKARDEIQRENLSNP